MDNPTPAVAPEPEPKAEAPAPKAAKADKPTDPVSIDDMRARGLRYTGSAVLHLPGSHRILPPQDLTGDAAARYIPDRKTLLWVLDHGYTVPPAKETE